MARTGTRGSESGCRAGAGAPERDVCALLRCVLDRAEGFENVEGERGVGSVRAAFDGLCQVVDAQAAAVLFGGTYGSEEWSGRR